MRILIDARLYGLENTGIGRYIVNLVANLEKLDDKNEYFLLLRDKYFDSLKLKKNFTKVAAEVGHYSLLEQVKIPKIIAQYHPDIVHFPHFNVPLFFRGKFVVTIHDILMHKQKGLEATTLPAPQYYLKRLGYKKIFKHAVRSSTKIIVPTNFVKAELSDYYHLPEEKVEVIYEGVNDFKITNKNIVRKYGLTKPYLIYTGNAYPHKNLERAIAAILQLNKEGTEVQFAIISARNVFTERLVKLIKKLSAGKEVKLLGYVPDSDLGGLYKDSAGFLYPSLYEGFGLPGLEAMAAGTISLVSDIPVFREVYQGRALYFDPYKVDSIKQTIEKVLKVNGKERLGLISRGKKFIGRYSWPKMAQETLRVYEGAA